MIWRLAMLITPSFLVPVVKLVKNRVDKYSVKKSEVDQNRSILMKSFESQKKKT